MIRINWKPGQEDAFIYYKKIRRGVKGAAFFLLSQLREWRSQALFSVNDLPLSSKIFRAFLKYRLVFRYKKRKDKQFSEFKWYHRKALLLERVVGLCLGRLVKLAYQSVLGLMEAYFEAVAALAWCCLQLVHYQLHWFYYLVRAAHGQGVWC